MTGRFDYDKFVEINKIVREQRKENGAYCIRINTVHEDTVLIDGDTKPYKIRSIIEAVVMRGECWVSNPAQIRNSVWFK